MTWHLDPPICAARRVFAALTRVEVAVHGVGPMVMGNASKQVQTILMLEGDVVTALELDGQARSPEETARRYGAAVAELRDVVGEMTGS